MFLNLEGPEGSGKTYILEELKKRLTKRHVPFSVYHEPGGTELGEQLRDLLLHGESQSGEKFVPEATVLTYAAARSELVFNRIRPDLEHGLLVIADRYADSMRAIQGAQGVPRETLEVIHRYSTDGLEPHLTILLDVPAKIGLERKRKQGQWTDWEKKGEAFHEEVRQRFLQLASEYPRRIVVVDATQRPRRVRQAVFHIVEDRLREKAFIK